MAQEARGSGSGSGKSKTKSGAAQFKKLLEEANARRAELEDAQREASAAVQVKESTVELQQARSLIALYDEVELREG